jgi:hypothetical protein
MTMDDDRFEELDPAQATLLDLRLDRARRGLEQEQAPQEIEGLLARRFRATRAAARRPRLWWMPPVALAATVAIVSWMVRTPAPSLAPAAAPVAASDADAGPFLALRPLERIALEPGTTLVTTEFPRALLADWGLPVAPDRAGEPVRAEMLYSADGEPVAVRLIQ